MRGDKEPRSLNFASLDTMARLIGRLEESGIAVLDDLRLQPLRRAKQLIDPAVASEVTNKSALLQQEAMRRLTRRKRVDAGARIDRAFALARTSAVMRSDEAARERYRDASAVKKAAKRLTGLLHKRSVRAMLASTEGQHPVNFDDCLATLDTLTTVASDVVDILETGRPRQLLKDQSAFPSLLTEDEALVSELESAASFVLPTLPTAHLSQTSEDKETAKVRRFVEVVLDLAGRGKSIDTIGRVSRSAWAKRAAGGSGFARARRASGGR